MIFLSQKNLLDSLLAILLMGIVASFTATATAHTSGVSIEKTVGNYLLDIGYSPEVLFENTQVRFDFSIYNSDKTEELDFSEVWVRIEKDERLLFAGGLNKARFGVTGLSYNFSDGGNYRISTRFSGATTTLAEAEFDFLVNTMEIPLTEKVWFKVIIYTSIPWLIVVVTLIIYIAFFRPKRQEVSNKTTNKSHWLPVFLNTVLFVGLVIIGYFVASKAQLLLSLL